MKQYEITEDNDWEGETFGYILTLTDEQFEKIKTGFEIINEDEGYDKVTIEPCDYSQEQIDLINKKSRNRYMDRVNYYELNENEFNLDSFEYSDFPYKGNGMKRLF